MYAAIDIPAASVAHITCSLWPGATPTEVRPTATAENPTKTQLKYNL